MKKSQNTQTTTNKYVLSDYEMNERIAENICNIIEKGDVQEWKKGWTLNDGSNDCLRNIYDLVLDGMTAINVYSLKTFDWCNGNPIPSGFYVSFKDIKNHNLHLKKGSKGVATYKACKFDKYLTKAEEQALETQMQLSEDFKIKIEALLNGEHSMVSVEFDVVSDKGNKYVFKHILQYNKKTQKLYYSRFQFVLEYQFNIDCLEEKLDVKKLWGISKAKKKVVNNPNERIEKIELIREDYCNRAKVGFKEENQGRAYYQPSTHSVVLPTFAQFDSAEEYYGTMFHELAHSTGAKQLLNRTGICSFNKWGDTTYAKEELVAELSSIFSLKAVGVATDLTFKNSIAYLKSWGSSLKEGIRHNILMTISQSQKASELILNIDRKATAK